MLIEADPAVEAFDSPAMRARLAELLRRQGIDAGAAPPKGPRRFVALYWEPAGDELALADGVHSGAGQLRRWLWLDDLHGRTPGVPPPVLGPIAAWLVEHQVDLGSSDAPATHALVVDADSRAAWSRRWRSPAASSGLNRSPRSSSHDHARR